MASGQNKISEVISTKTAEVFLIDGPILVIKFIDNGFEADLDEILLHIAAGKKLTDNKKAPILVDVRESFYLLTKEAEEMAAKEEHKLAEAILVSALHQRLIGTFFLKLSHQKNKHPVKMFTSEKEAIKWLKQFVSK